MFCFICDYCGHRVETAVRQPEPTCTHELSQLCADTELVMRRDWATEGVGVGQGVRVSRDGTLSDQAHLFLPTNDEFKGPGDPDGTRGMRAWHEHHEPRADNPRPVHPGRVEKRSF